MANRSSPFRILGGDIIVSVDIQPDPKEIELELMRIAGNLENLNFPLAGSVAAARRDMQERFDTETDPNGDHWIPLDEEYLTSKQSLGYPDDILHREGDLERAATSTGAFKIVGDSMFFDTSVLPSYGLLHQTGVGTENVGLASRHRFAASSEEGYAKREGGAHSNIGIGRGNALPARPFIGLSEEAEGEIWKIFDAWFDEATSIAINPLTGTIQQRMPAGSPGGIGGQFGPKVVL